MLVSGSVGFKKSENRGTVKLKFLYLATSERVRFGEVSHTQVTMVRIINPGKSPIPKVNKERQKDKQRIMKSPVLEDFFGDVASP